MQKDKRFWTGISLLNLCLVALFGLLMRTKIIFPVPFLDYRNLLNAHSHFAFCGWVGLALTTLTVYNILPAAVASSKKYGAVLWGIQLSSLAMAISFPIGGYNLPSILFSTAYTVVTYYFAWIYFADLRRLPSLHPVVKLLSVGSVLSLILSSVGPFILAYIMVSKSANSLLYRDAIYTFLHFQYNGFFTLAVFALFVQQWLKKGLALPPRTVRFAGFLTASVVPSLFVAMLWHNSLVLYLLASAGCLCILISLWYFLPVLLAAIKKSFAQQPALRFLVVASLVSFFLKMLLTTGTLYPPLGQAVYGARPVIIGFLHLVFLAFVSFYILSTVVEEGWFHAGKKFLGLGVYLFAAGVLANEAFLMIQGLEILFKNNSDVYNRMLWTAAIVLFLGALSMAAAFYRAKTKAPL